MNPARSSPRLLDIERLMLDIIRQLSPVVRRIRQHDRDLADQLRRAASSVSLNLGEGLASTAGTRRARLETAAGSLAETRQAVAVAQAWGYIERRTLDALDAELDRVAAMLHRLRRR